MPSLKPTPKSQKEQKDEPKDSVQLKPVKKDEVCKNYYKSYIQLYFQAKAISCCTKNFEYTKKCYALCKTSVRRLPECN